jgi:hypothetical protein
VEEIVSKAALEMFEMMFEDVDLSAELAMLRVSGEGSKKASAERKGFVPTQTPKSKRRKRR